MGLLEGPDFKRRKLGDGGGSGGEGCESSESGEGRVDMEGLALAYQTSQ